MTYNCCHLEFCDHPEYHRETGPAILMTEKDSHLYSGPQLLCDALGVYIFTYLHLLMPFLPFLFLQYNVFDAVSLCHTIFTTQTYLKGTHNITYLQKELIFTILRYFLCIYSTIIG